MTVVGTVTVNVTIWYDDYETCIEDEFDILATADLIIDDGSVSTAMSYYENIEPYYSDEFKYEIADFVETKYGDLDYEWYIDEDSFVEND